MKPKIRLSVLALVLMVALSLVPMSSVAAQKWPAPQNVVVGPALVQFNGLADTQTVAVAVRRVFNFYAADFTLEFDPSVINVLSVDSGPAFDHPDMPGAPTVHIGPGTVTFANTRFGDPIPYADSLRLATITFVSVVPGPVGPLAWGGGSIANVADKTGMSWAFPLTGDYEVLPGAGVQGQAFWAPDHSLIPVQITNSSGLPIAQRMTLPGGKYPDAPWPPMPPSGQIRINPMVLGRVPTLETRLVDCPALPNLTPRRVYLVRGDVAPAHPSGMTGDNAVDIGDLVLCSSRFMLPGIDSNGDGWIDGDTNNDGLVNITDIVNIANNFGKTGPICLDCP
jgi:hypothetical protein